MATTALTRRTRGTVVFGTIALSGVVGAIEKVYPQYLNPGGWPVLRIIAAVAGIASVASKRPKRAMYFGMVAMSIGAPQSYKFGQSIVG